MSGPGRGNQRQGLPPAAVGAMALVLIAVGVGAGWLVGSVGSDSQPTPVMVDWGGSDGGGTPSASGAPLAAPSPAEVAEGDLGDRGATVFQEQCAGCHTIGGGDRKGPDLATAALRYDVSWVRAMVHKPDSMFAADTTAQRILRAHGVSQGDVSSSDPQIGALLAYLRSFDRGY